MRVKKDIPQDKTILGIDPGTNYTGYGVIRVNKGEPECLILGYIDLVKYKDPYEKLRNIFERVARLVKQYKPDEVALESPFFGENVQSMLKLGRAQGVAMAAALTQGVPVFEYAPRKIKQSITGNGGASKEQVATMLSGILKVEYTIKKLDATDGLAVALCHFYESSSLLNSVESVKNDKLAALTSASRKKVSWEKFMADNPGRELKK